MSRLDITQQALKNHLAYNPNTGVFTWVNPTANCMNKGDVAGGPDDQGYSRIRICGFRHKAHRLAFLYMEGDLPPDEVDHINGITSDNRWLNLRKVTHSENQRNKSLQSNNSSGVTGVSWYARGEKWECSIFIDGKKLHLGRFHNLSDACRVRKEAETKHNYHANHGRQG